MLIVRDEKKSSYVSLGDIDYLANHINFYNLLFVWISFFHVSLVSEVGHQKAFLLHLQDGCGLGFNIFSTHQNC